jgi:hypothetical protein
MNIVDATCLGCSISFRWLSGTPRLCTVCQAKEKPGAAYLYNLFIPLNHNGGRPMQPERLNWVEEEIRAYAGGLTAYAPGMGFWTCQTSRIYQDLVLPVQVVAPLVSETDAWFADFVTQMAIVLEQRSIFIFCHPVYLLKGGPSNYLAV